MKRFRGAGIGEVRFATTRMENLSDGVFAIVLTLLVLELRLPNPPLPGSRISEELLANVPDMIGWLLSFLVLGRLWMIHHRALADMTRCSARTLLANFVFIATISLVPFAANLVGAYEFAEPISLVVFSIMLASTSIALGLVLLSVSKDVHADAHRPTAWSWAVRHHLMLLPVIAVIAGGAAAIHPSITTIIFCIESVAAIAVLITTSGAEDGG